MKSVSEELIIKYLLGLLSEDHQVWFEEQYFFDDTVFERLSVTEQILIDRYARASLCEREAAAFEHRFLQCRERRRRVGYALAQQSCRRGSQ